MPTFSHPTFNLKENYRYTHDILAEFITVKANQEAQASGSSAASQGYPNRGKDRKGVSDGHRCSREKWNERVTVRIIPLTTRNFKGCYRNRTIFELSPIGAFRGKIMLISTKIFFNIKAMFLLTDKKSFLTTPDTQQELKRPFLSDSMSHGRVDPSQWLHHTSKMGLPTVTNVTDSAVQKNKLWIFTTCLRKEKLILEVKKYH